MCNFKPGNPCHQDPDDPENTNLLSNDVFSSLRHYQQPLSTSQTLTCQLPSNQRICHYNVTEAIRVDSNKTLWEHLVSHPRLWPNDELYSGELHCHCTLFFPVYVMTLALDLSLAKDGTADCTMIMTPRFYLEIENSFMKYV